MEEKLISSEEIMLLIHENTENSFSHTTYRKENERFYLLMQGDMRAVEESDYIIEPSLQGKLSDDPLKNMRYLFIVNTGLATRYTIEAGVPQEEVYSVSDLYIRKADKATSAKDIRRLNLEIWTRFVNMVRENIKNYSRPISHAMDYVSTHFNSRITLEDVANEVRLNPCYLERRFKEEVGVTFGEYLISLRIKTAKALLTRTDYSYSNIALSLSFCTQSYFTKRFKERTGYTPKQYRSKFYNKNIS